jgi:hypothetical protein
MSEPVDVQPIRPFTREQALEAWRARHPASRSERAQTHDPRSIAPNSEIPRSRSKILRARTHPLRRLRQLQSCRVNNGRYVAVDLDGDVVGTFSTLKAAAASFDGDEEGAS